MGPESAADCVLQCSPARFVLLQKASAFCVRGRILVLCILRLFVLRILIATILCVLVVTVLCVLVVTVLCVLLCLILAVGVGAILVFVRRVILVIQDTHLLTTCSMVCPEKNIRNE